MITVKFRDTFRERFPEWICSLSILIWGFITATQTEAWIINPALQGMLVYTSQNTWGTFAIILGLSRLTFLSINGFWRPTAHLRAISAGLSMIVWGAILITYVFSPASSPGFGPILGIFLLDLSALWFAAGDAKVADTLAKKTSAVCIKPMV